MPNFEKFIFEKNNARNKIINLKKQRAILNEHINKKIFHPSSLYFNGRGDNPGRPFEILDIEPFEIIPEDPEKNIPEKDEGFEIVRHKDFKKKDKTKKSINKEDSKHKEKSINKEDSKHTEDSKHNEQNNDIPVYTKFKNRRYLDEYNDDDDFASA